MIPVCIGISLVIFFLVNLLPGNFIEARANPGISAEQIEHLKELYGINDPIHIKYWKWFKGAITGDFGYSFTYVKPVSEVIGSYAWNSFILAFSAFLLELAIAVPFGILSAARQYSRTDKLLTLIALAGISIPPFFIGLLLKKIFFLDLKILPMANMTTPGADYTGLMYVWDVICHLIMPCFVLAFSGAGFLMRHTRTAVLEVLGQDYIRTARAKGLSERKVLFKHALRNALIPVVTIVGLSLPGLFSGAIITESIFGLPGIGKVALDAMTKRDYPLMMGFSMFVAVITLVGNLLSDIIYAAVDPRVKLEVGVSPEIPG